MAVATEAAGRLTTLYKKPNELEFEKIFYPMVLFAKKRYAAVKYVPGTDTVQRGSLDYKGISLVRRDSCKFVQDVSKEVLEKILFDRSPQGALEAAAASVKRLLDGDVPMEALTLTRALRSHYKNGGDALAHVQVSKKIQERTGEVVPSGTRIKFVFILSEEGRCKEDLQGSFAEDVEHVVEQNLQLDYLHYLDHQLVVPVMTYISATGYTQSDLLQHPICCGAVQAARAERSALFKDTKGKRYREENKIRDIRSFFKKK